MEDIKSRVGRNIKAARIEKGMTQKEVSELLKVNETAVTNYEAGRQNLTLDTIQRIATALSIDVTQLIK